MKDCFSMLQVQKLNVTPLPSPAMTVIAFLPPGCAMAPGTAMMEKMKTDVVSCLSCVLYQYMKDVCWLLNVPATCWCISGMDLLRQFYVLSH